MIPFEPVIKALVRFLSREDLTYVILGGVSVSIYGKPRLTADVDVNIMLDKEKIKDFLRKAKKFGFAPILGDAESFARKVGVIPMKFVRDEVVGRVDVIIAENPLEFSALRRGRMRRIGSLKARFVSPEDLIVHKISSARPRDHEDLRGIILRQKGKLDLDYIRGWLKKLDKVEVGLGLYKRFQALLKE